MYVELEDKDPDIRLCFEYHLLSNCVKVDIYPSGNDLDIVVQTDNKITNYCIDISELVDWLENTHDR